LSAAGDRLWTEVVPLPAGPLPTIEQSIAPNGDVFVSASSFALYEKLVSIDGTTGAVRWNQDLVFPTYSPNSPVVESIAATDDGDLLVASWYPTIVQIQEEVRFGRFDGTTGAMEWEFSAQTFFQQNTFEMRASRHGVDLVDSGLVSPPTHRALRVGLDGSVVFSSSVPSPGTGPRRLDTDDAGNLYADFRNGAYVAFDAAGSPLWSRTYTAFGLPVEMRDVGPAGEIIGIAQAGDAYLATFEPSGAPRGTSLVNHSAIAVYDVQVADDGGTLVIYDAPPPALPGSIRAAHFAPQGLRSWENDLGLEAVFTQRGLITSGRNGHVWVAAARDSAFGIDPAGYTLKIVPGGDAGVPSCSATAPNSTGVTGRLRAVGSSDAATNNLTLLADRLPPLQFVLFLNARTGDTVPNPGGSDGTLCLGGPIARYVRPGEIRRASPVGLASLELDLTSTPSGVGTTAILAGDTWHFQAWHRDTTTAGSNLTGATEVQFD
ncbi:MAG: hypothetical protein AAFZ87_13865, partial [Planctomycetota bacterium]